LTRYASMGRNGYVYEARKGEDVYIGKAGELAEIFGVTREKVTCAYSQGYKLQGYELTKVEDALADSDGDRITPKMWQQWDDECLKFRRAYAQRRQQKK